MFEMLSVANSFVEAHDVCCELFGMDLAIDDSLHYQLLDLLSPDECDRMGRLVQVKHQRNFLAARGGLRVCLGRYLDCAPESLVFECEFHGKPRLRDFPGVEFNFSHSDDRGLIGISEGRAIGVDLERVRVMPSMLGLAKRFFAPQEVAAIVSVSEAEQMPLFFQYWTCKEAYLKGTGDGLGKIGKLAVAIPVPGGVANGSEQVQVIQRPCDKNFALAQVQVVDGFVGAMAIEV